jgi:hypothetical protein
MSAGKRYKYQGSQIQFLTEFGANSPPISITAISKANPAVATASGHGRTSGDVIYVSGVVGMVEVNEKVYIIEVVDSSHIKLLDEDSSSFSTYVSGGIFDYGSFSDFCEVTAGPNRTGGTKPEIQVSTVCSNAVEKEFGLRDFGNATITYNYAPLTSVNDVQAALDRWDESGDMMAYKVTLPKDGGTITRLGTVTQTSDQGQVNGIWTGSATIALQRNPYRQTA